MAEASIRHPDLPPTHPGETLKEDVFPSLGLTTTTAAARIGISRARLDRIFAGQAAITSTLAVKLGKLTGTAPRLWMNMQTAHDLWRAERDIDISGIVQASAG